MILRVTLSLFIKRTDVFGNRAGETVRQFRVLGALRGPNSIPTEARSCRELQSPSGSAALRLRQAHTWCTYVHAGTQSCTLKHLLRHKKSLRSWGVAQLAETPPLTQEAPVNP